MVRRLFRLPLRRSADVRADADAELASFLDARVEQLVAHGMTAAEARTEATRRLAADGVDAARARLHRSAIRRESAVRRRDGAHRLRDDLRFALRQLAAAPGFAVVAVLTLALGVGASTAIFSAVRPILLDRLPYPHAERIVTIWDQGQGRPDLPVTFNTARELAARSRSFEALATYKPWQPTLTGATDPERLDGQRVEAGYFRALGIAPALGRALEASDDRGGAARAVVLSDGLWRRRFGGDSAIVGRLVTLDGDAFTVIGVMPRGFENVLAPSAVLWTTLGYEPSQPRAWGHHLQLVARLRPGVSVAAAQREIARIAESPDAAFPRVPWASLDNGLEVRALREDVTRGVRPALLAVAGAVLLLLTIACVNVTNLLLARAARRRAEFATRAAIGAGRGRIVRQLLTESLVLAAIGGVAGLLVARVGVRALVALAPAGLPRASAIGLDGSVLAFGVALTTVVGLVVGLTPAVQAARGDLHAELQHGSRRTMGGNQRTRRALVVAEVALALMLLVGAGLLLRSVRHQFAIAPGFDASSLLTMQVQTAGHRDDGATVRYFARTLDAVRDVPGVGGAAFVSQLPLSGERNEYGVQLEIAAPGERIEAEGPALRYAVSPGYVEAMRIPLRAGRAIDARDVVGAPPVAMVSESFARRRFGTVDPLGRRLRIGDASGPWATVVGVVGDVKQSSLDLGPAEAVYMSTAQWAYPDRVLSLVVRARGDAAALAPAVKRAIWAVDREQPVEQVATMRAVLAASAAERRFVLVLFEAFALVALALAAVGIYGVLAGSVAERVREIGVRAALGASRGALLGRELQRGALLAVAGTALGIGGAVIGSRALASLLFGVSRLDVATYAGVVALVGAVVAAACAVPAWRAARVEPSVALREE